MGMLVNLSDNFITLWISTNPYCFNLCFILFIIFISFALKNTKTKTKTNKQKKNTEDMQTLVIRT